MGQCLGSSQESSEQQQVYIHTVQHSQREGWTMEGGGVRENERVAAWVGERMGERLIISNVN